MASITRGPHGWSGPIGIIASPTPLQKACPAHKGKPGAGREKIQKIVQKVAHLPNEPIKRRYYASARCQVDFSALLARPVIVIARASSGIQRGPRQDGARAPATDTADTSASEEAVSSAISAVRAVTPRSGVRKRRPARIRKSQVPRQLEIEAGNSNDQSTQIVHHAKFQHYRHHRHY